MIVTTLIAATVAGAQPAPKAEPVAAPAPTAAKKMACCEKMAKGEGCCCCKDEAKAKAGTADEHAGHEGHSS